MAEVNGKMVTCDRCADSIFLKCTGEGERDGGYTRWNTFEPYPEGWGYVEIPSKKSPSRLASIRVCPLCRALWDNVVNEHFLRGTELYQIEVKEGD